MDILRRMDMFLITKILDLAYLQNNMRFARSRRSLNREDSDKYTLTITFTKMLIIYVFSIFTIITSRALAVLQLLGLLTVKTLTNVLSLLQKWVNAFYLSEYDVMLCFMMTL